MHFNDALREQRLARNLSEERAADKTHLSLRGYRDRETGECNPNFAERCGLLACLGLKWDDAKAAAENKPFYPLSDMALRAKKIPSQPFVENRPQSFVLISRQHNNVTCKISKRKLRSKEDVLNWVHQASQKAWITGEHINMFIDLALRWIEHERELAAKKKTPTA